MDIRIYTIAYIFNWLQYAIKFYHWLLVFKWISILANIWMVYIYNYGYCILIKCKFRFINGYIARVFLILDIFSKKI